MSQALVWGAEQGMSIRGLLSSEQLEELARVFAGERAWTFELYEPLRAWAHALPRLEAPDLPARVHFGDALTALNEVLSGKAAWPVATTPAPSTLAELGYAETSAGITRLRERHAAAWRQHAEANKQLLRRAAELSSGRHVTVLGAGKLYDIPLQKLAERYAQVTLVDVDGAALAESLQQAGLSAGLRGRVELVTADVTGVNAAFLERLNQSLAAPDEPATYDALLELLHGYRLESPPSLGNDACDVVLSSMLLSQLATPLTELVQRRFRERFPKSERLGAHAFRVALAQLTHRVQHDHVQALLATAPLVALTSDVSEQFFQLDALGTATPSSPELPLIGAPHLEDLFPAQQARVVESASWSWQRVPVTPKTPRGRKLRVIGTIATRL